MFSYIDEGVWFGLVLVNVSSSVQPWKFQILSLLPFKNITGGKCGRKRQECLGITAVPDCIYSGKEIWNKSLQIFKIGD